MTALAPGHTLGERFQLIRRLGTGGMGDVWLVEDLELSDRVVAKIVPADATEDQLVLLRRECRHARKLAHSNIVPVYEFHRVSGVAFITMAYVEGDDIGTLRGRPLEEVLPALIAIADALRYAHAQGVVHRDLKAANVLVDKTGAPRLLDFGIAGVVDEDGVELRGGGTEESASPEQLAGNAPTVADDVYAFGALARDLLAGQRLEVDLDALLNAAMNRDPRHRPRTMAEIKEKLEGIAPAPGRAPGKDVKLTPPPKVRRVAPITPPPRIDDRGAPAVAFARERPRGGADAKTIATFVALFAIAIGVFFVLPRWVEQSGSPVVRPKSETPRAAEAPTPDVAEPGEPEESGDADLADLGQQMAEAENVRERALALRQTLDERSAGVWGGDAYREAVASLDRGEEQMGRRAFADARVSFESALSRLESVRASASGIASDAIRRGRNALAAGSASEAEDAFSLALQIQPGSAEAKQGLARAKVLDELRLLVARGQELEGRGDLDGAAASYRKAVALDPASQAAQQGLARIDSRASERAFTEAMSQAVAALNRQDFEAARAAYEQARAIQPEAADVAAGLRAVEEGERTRAIADHRDRALAFEQREAWRSAEEQYQAVLDIDDTIRFAREGKARASVRAALSEKLAFHIGNPERLSEHRVLEEARELLDDASAVDNPGPEIREQIARLSDLVAEFSTPVQVVLLSDGETEVVVYKIGTLGKFASHALVLRPGTYTVVGRREGYRDVRHRLVVRADPPPEPLLVRCEEEI